MLDSRIVSATNEYSYCMVAVLTSCDCTSSLFTKDFMSTAEYFQDLDTLIVGGEPTYDLIMGDPDGPTLEVFDISQLTDTVGLVCSPSPDYAFCGLKQLVLLDSSGISVDLSSGVFQYDEVSRELKINTFAMTIEDTFTLKVKLKDYDTNPEYFPQMTTFSFS